MSNDFQEFLKDLGELPPEEKKEEIKQEEPEKEPEEKPEPKAEHETQKESEKEPEKEPEIEIPEKFKNKDIQEIIKSYIELEKEKGRLASELGQLRQELELLKKEEEKIKETPPAEPELNLDKIGQLIYEGQVKEGLKALVEAIDTKYQAVVDRYAKEIERLKSELEATRQKTEAERMERLFYEKYPDMKGKEDLMELVALRMQRNNEFQKFYDTQGKFNVYEYWEELVKRVRKLAESISPSKKEPPKRQPPTTTKKTSYHTETEKTVADEIEELKELF